MKYKKYEFPSFNVYTIKNDKFKSCHMEIIYRDKASKNDLLERSIIGDILASSSKKYPKLKDVVIKKEDLYQTKFYAVTTRVGNTAATNFVLNFINPAFALEKDFLEEVLKFPFEMITNPNVENDEFENRIFTIIKNNYKDSIKGIKENPSKLAIREALFAMDPNSPTSYGLLNSEEYLNDLTSSMLYKSYKSMLKNSLCDIFIIGNLDMDKVVKIIEKNFKNRSIKPYDVNLYVDNNSRKKPQVVEKDSSFVQSNLLMIYNLNDLSKRERDMVFPIFNHVFGNGTLNCKLNKYLREENSLCYGVSSMYMKYDRLLVVNSSLAKANIKLAVNLVKKALKEMQTGKFSDEEIEDAKTNIIFGTNVALDNPVSILDNYVFNIYDNIFLLEERIKEIKTVTKEEVISLAKKIKLNTTFVLNEGDN